MAFHGVMETLSTCLTIALHSIQDIYFTIFFFNNYRIRYAVFITNRPHIVRLRPPTLLLSMQVNTIPSVSEMREGARSFRGLYTADAGCLYHTV